MPQEGTIWHAEGENKGSSKKILFVAVAVFAISAVLAGAGLYFYLKSDRAGNAAQHLSTEGTKELLDRVAELIVLPTDEQPTIATVSDPQQLKDQPFFAKAQRGFKVLIYTNAKKAILYDPVKHKVVEVAPLNLGETAGTTTQ